MPIQGEYMGMMLTIDDVDKEMGKEVPEKAVTDPSETQARHSP